MVGLVVGQGDLGTALVLFAIVLGMLWVVGAPTRLFMGTFLVVAVAAFALVSTERERVERLTGFLDPMADYGGSGWQASHGFFALATGGLWGRGIGASNQKWGGLPEAHTDYIFAIIGEEFGLFGTRRRARAVRDAGVRRRPDRGPHEGPVRAVRVRRDRRVAAVAKP